MSIQQEIQELKSELSSLNKEKEFYFQEKEKLKKELKSKIDDLNQKKRISISSGDKIRNAKNSRNTINDEVKKLILEAKQLNEKKNVMLSKIPGNEDPGRIAKQIKDLDFKIQTDVLSISQEKQVMKKIKDLKKLYGSQKDASLLLKEMRNLSQKITERRNKADNFHQQLTKLVSEKQELSSIIESSKELMILRGKQEEAFKKFIELKSKAAEKNKQLHEKFLLMDKERNQQFSNKKQQEQKRHQYQESLLRAKEKAVEEKLKKRKRLTNEDLLVFQRS